MHPTIPLIHSTSERVLGSSSRRGEAPGAMRRDLRLQGTRSALAPCVEYHGCPWHRATVQTHAACHGCQEAFNPRMTEQSLGTTCQQLPLRLLLTQSPNQPQEPSSWLWGAVLLKPPPPRSLQVCRFTGLELAVQSGAGQRTQTSGYPYLNGHGTPTSIKPYTRVSAC